MKKQFIAIGVIVAVLIIMFFAFNSFIYKEKQESGPIVPYEGTLSGTQTCLPHKDTSGPQTLECAIGIETDAGEFYALDLSAVSMSVEQSQAIASGARFTASGTITPIEALSTNHWQKYDVEGILSVTGIITPTPQARCFVGGCSSHICSDDPNVASSCEYREEYGCYRTATCERQSNGACGWTETAVLRACIMNAR